MDATLQAILAELFRASADVQKLLARIKELEAEIERLRPPDTPALDGNSPILREVVS